MKSKLADAINYLIDAQHTLEFMPCGGIGKDGATQAELDEASNEKKHYDNDASYHQSQQAWLEIDKAIGLLRDL